MVSKLPVILGALSAPFAVVLGVVLVATLVVPQVTLAAERSPYAIGDTVRFTLRNGLRESVYLTCSAPWRIYRDVGGGDWRPVEQHGCIQLILEVSPGGTKTWSWVAETQKDPTGLAPVEPGRYRIDLSVLAGCDPSAGGCQTIRLLAFFQIV